MSIIWALGSSTPLSVSRSNQIRKLFAPLEGGVAIGQ
jgi:hypothetical protein